MSAAFELLSAFERLLQRLCSRASTRIALFAALALIAEWPLLSTAGALVDFRDAQYFTLFEEAARIAVAKFHEAPLWNPYYCGGIPALATPSARFVSPTFLLSLLLGTLRADSVIAFFMTTIGLEGAFRYARSRGATALGAAFAAPIFALSGIFATAPPLGWTNFFGFELIPWVAYGVRLALTGRSVRGAVLAALALAWIVGFGGTYATPLAILLCTAEGLFALLAAARSPSRLATIVRSSGVIALVALGAAAVRLWPIAELLSTSPRILGGMPGNDLEALQKALFGDGDWRGAFLVGVAAVPIAVIGLVLGVSRRRSPPLLVMASLWLWLAAGYVPNPSIFAALRTVPPFTMLRYPERFLALFALALAVLAALGQSSLERLARRWPIARMLSLACVLALAGNTAQLVLNAYAEDAGRALLPAPVGESRDFKQARGNRWLAAEYSAMGRGSLSCFDDYEVPQSPLLRGDLPAEEYLKDSATGTVERKAWSPDRIDLHVRLAKSGRLYVNQNWHPGWRASVGQVANDNGLLAVDLPDGEREVSLRFAPRSALGGGSVTAASLFVAAILWRGRRRRIPGGVAAVRLYALAAAPLLVGALVRWAVAEPAFPPRPLIAPTGEEVVAAAPPDDAIPMRVRFQGGITLEAARMRLDPLAVGGQSLLLELDWRLASKAPAGLGVFVHVSGMPDDKNVNVDHALLSSVIPFEAAPQGVTVRDISAPIALPPGEVVRTWTVRVGLWMARRGGDRVPVEDKGGVDVDEDRVLLGKFDVAPPPPEPQDGP